MHNRVPSELHIIGTKVGQNGRVCRVGGEAAIKELIHGLERDALCLGNEEVDEDDGAEHEGCEEEVDAEAHGVEHLRGEAGDEEVPEPVVCRGESLCESAD